MTSTMTATTDDEVTTQAMTIGVPKEGRPGERLVAATPKTVAQLVALGYEVRVQEGAGAAANFPDDEYVSAGAVVGPAADAWSADIVTAVNAPSDAELDALATGSTLVSVL
ncbi:MAG: hypothetical protein L6311_17225, partial [Cellulomonas sp.]|nr:hypothetical protein [Cellulomonas sp.]